MSTPTGGSWNNDQGQSDPQGQGAPQGGQGHQGQSLGQGFGQQQNPQQGQQDPGQQQGQPAYGQSAPQQGYSQPQPPAYGQPADHGQQAGPAQGQHGGFGGQPQSAGRGFTSGAAQIGPQTGEGLGELFSDLQFKKSLTEKIASVTFFGVILWALLNFISNLIYNFGSEDFGGTSVKHMSTFSAIMHSLTDLVWLIIVIAIVRIVLELVINVARIAHRSKD